MQGDGAPAPHCWASSLCRRERHIGARASTLRADRPEGFSLPRNPPSTDAERATTWTRSRSSTRPCETASSRPASRSTSPRSWRSPSSSPASGSTSSRPASRSRPTATSKSVEAIAKAVRGPIIAGLSRTGFKDVDRAWEAVRHAERAAHPRVHRDVEDPHGEEAPHDAGAGEGGGRGRRSPGPRATVDDVEFSPEDGYRSDPDFMCEVCQIAVDNGATTLNIPDTVGFAVPEDYGKLIRYVIDNVKGDFVVSTHCHDDLGLAVANSLAGVANGARQVECAINGLGERAGNAALEEVVMAIRTRRDYFERRRRRTCSTEELARTSRLVSRLTGYHVQYNKAVVGRNAFAHEAGIHQHGVLADRETYEIIDASHGRPGSRADRAGQALGPPRVRRHAREDGHPRAGRRAQRRVRAVQGARRQEGRDHRSRPRSDRRRGARHRRGAPVQRARARAARRHGDASRRRASCSATATARSRRAAAATA